MKKKKKGQRMIFIGLRNQRNELGDWIDEIDMRIICAENDLEVRRLEMYRKKLCKALGKGFGFVCAPK